MADPREAGASIDGPKHSRTATRRLPRKAAAVVVLVGVALVNMGADGGCAPNSKAPAGSECVQVQNSRKRAECLGKYPNDLSPTGRQLIADFTQTYAQGKPFPWQHYKIVGVEDRTAVGVLKDGDPLNTVVFPAVADLMVGPDGIKTDKTNAAAYCVTALALDNERRGPLTATLEGVMFGSVVGAPVQGGIAGAVTYLEARDKWIPSAIRAGDQMQKDAQANGVEGRQTEDNAGYAAARSMCDDTFPVHGLGSLAKGWGGANPLKSATESEVRRICGESCDGSPNPITGKGPPIPMIVGLADGFKPVATVASADFQAPRTGPATEGFRRRDYARPAKI